MRRTGRDREEESPGQRETPRPMRFFGDYQYKEPLKSRHLLPAEKNGFFRVEVPAKKTD